jgi:glycosyltransferase involved in cell wall biosynthesis
MADRKRVLLLIKGLAVGGAEKLLVSSLPYLDTKAFDYRVAYFLSEKNNLVSEIEKAGIPVTCLNINRLYDLSAVFRLTSHLRKEKIDILHIHSPHAGILGRIAARLSGVKVIAYTEHMPIDRLGVVARYCNILTYPLDDLNIGVSNAVLKSVLHRLIIKHGKYVTVHNGIDLNTVSRQQTDIKQIKKEFGIDPKFKIVGNVANLYPGKGHKYLLEAARIILDRYPDVVFLIVGKEKNIKDLEELKNLTKRLNIENRVIFAGFRQDTFRLIPAFDIFVLPSLWEGFGIVLLEAMSFGKPVIASNVDGIPEIIDDGKNGYLVEPRNPDRIAEKTLFLLENPQICNQMGMDGKQKVFSHFSIEKKVKEVEKLYTELVDKKLN